MTKSELKSLFTRIRDYMSENPTEFFNLQNLDIDGGCDVNQEFDIEITKETVDTILSVL